MTGAVLVTGTVVVGAGLAGLRTAQGLRRAGYAEAITLVGAENELPYDRPPLSKDFLLGKAGRADIELLDEVSLKALDLDLRLGVVASDLDVARHELSAGSDRLRYEALVIATGAAPRQLPAGLWRPGVHTLRTVADATAIRDAFCDGARVAVVGGGFIGAEVAHAARMLGLDVTVIDPLPVLMQRGLGPAVGSALAQRHAAAGVHLRLGRSVTGIDGAGRVERVVLDDGSHVDADVVVVGIGADPVVGWLDGSGLEVVGGVACDGLLRAAPDVYAVGDVARWAAAGGHRRMEHWTNATDQATAVAATITGTPTRYEPVPYVWSDQLGQRLQVWGEVDAADELIYLVGDAGAQEFVAATGAAGRLRAVVGLGARRDAMRAARLLQAGAAWLPGVGPVEDAA